MDGPQLWKLFLDAAVPTGDLKELGYDLFWVRARPNSKESSRAVAALGNVLSIKPEFAYHAFNILGDQGLLQKRSVLEQLANDYGSRRFWANLAPSTAAYINRVAARVNIIQNASQPPTQKPPTAAGQTPKTAAAPSPPVATALKSKMSTYVAIAFSVIAFNEFLKAAIRRWQQNLITNQ